MSWNYRILRHPDEAGDEVYGIHEVHYTDKGEPKGWSDRPMIVGNSVQDLLTVLEQVRDGMHKPIIDIREKTAKYEEIPDIDVVVEDE